MLPGVFISLDLVVSCLWALSLSKSVSLVIFASWHQIDDLPPPQKLLRK